MDHPHEVLSWVTAGCGFSNCPSVVAGCNLAFCSLDPTGVDLEKLSRKLSPVTFWRATVVALT